MAGQSVVAGQLAQRLGIADRTLAQRLFADIEHLPIDGKGICIAGVGAVDGR